MKQSTDLTGLCSAGRLHHKCPVEWDTPSAHVRCRCECHAVRVVVPKTRVSKVVVKKSR